MNRALYETDFVAWTRDQAAQLRAGALDSLDREHLAEEIESIGASERRELRRRLARLLQHLSKYQFQPEHRSRSWGAAISAQRDEINAILEDSPSLSAAVAEMLPRAYRLGRGWALEETGLLDLPPHCPWPVVDILDTGFLPRT